MTIGLNACLKAIADGVGSRAAFLMIACTSSGSLDHFLQTAASGKLPRGSMVACGGRLLRAARVALLAVLIYPGFNFWG